MLLTLSQFIGPWLLLNCELSEIKDCFIFILVSPFTEISKLPELNIEFNSITPKLYLNFIEFHRSKMEIEAYLLNSSS